MILPVSLNRIDHKNMDDFFSRNMVYDYHENDNYISLPLRRYEDLFGSEELPDVKMTRYMKVYKEFIMFIDDQEWYHIPIKFFVQNNIKQSRIHDNMITFHRMYLL